MPDRIAQAASNATYGGAATAVLFGMTAHELAAVGGFIAAIVGALVGVGGLALNAYYKHKHFQLAEKRAGLGEEE